MNDKVGKFCDSIHEKLESLEGRLDALKLNIGTTWHSLEQKLDDARQKGEVSKPTLREARIKLEQWATEKEAEPRTAIDQWIADRETQKLAARAQQVEDCAGIAIMIAQASIDDVERMVLEAIAARREAETVAVGKS